MWPAVCFLRMKVYVASWIAVEVVAGTGKVEIADSDQQCNQEACVLAGEVAIFDLVQMTYLLGSLPVLMQLICICSKWSV